MYFEPYDIIVVGAGHAGCEAAAAAANMGSRVLLITMDLRLMASMSCNPAMGGIAKGQIVREIDAMGGYSGIVSDRTMIQFRMLNKSKGPAMWSPRCQSDKMMFSAEWRRMLEKTPNVDFWQDTVIGLLVVGDQVKGVKTMMGGEIESKAVIANAKKIWVDEGGKNRKVKDLKSMDLYVKPEENAVYYVFNEEESGNFPLYE
jgi:tRNA uridine 5-carboxymethylaminomethyl modification enzyme